MSSYILKTTDDSGVSQVDHYSNKSGIMLSIETTYRNGIATITPTDDELLFLSLDDMKKTHTGIYISQFDEYTITELTHRVSSRLSVFKIMTDIQDLLYNTPDIDDDIVNISVMFNNYQINEFLEELYIHGYDILKLFKFNHLSTDIIFYGPLEITEVL